jgi:hypothetical protein
VPIAPRDCQVCLFILLVFHVHFSPAGKKLPASIAGRSLVGEEIVNQEGNFPLQGGNDSPASRQPNQSGAPGNTQFFLASSLQNLVWGIVEN